MSGAERRRVERHAVDAPGEMYISGGRRIPVRIVNLGELGALVSVTDLEVAVFEGERVVLRHPVDVLQPADSAESAAWRRTPGAVVRVDLEFAPTGVARNLAIFFDGGAPPEGYVPGHDDEG